MTCNSFLLNIYKDNDVKLDFAIYKHFRMTESARKNYNDPLPDLEELEESTRPTMRQNKWKMDTDNLCSEVYDLFDYDELVKKEIPELAKIEKEQVIEYMKNEYSSTYAGSKAKAEGKDKMKQEPPLRMQTPDDIKLAIERIIMYQKKPEESKTIKQEEGKAIKAPGSKGMDAPMSKAMDAPMPVTKKAEAKAIAKKSMTISKFQEYMGWYDKQSNTGKFSCMSNKSSLKKATPAIGRK